MDLAPSHAFSERLLKQMRPATSPIKLETVNGTVTVDKRLYFHIPSISRLVEVAVMDDSPPLLSLGRRCLYEGFSFY